jgi:putative peptide zinc metalloprotease protein
MSKRLAVVVFVVLGLAGGAVPARASDGRNGENGNNIVQVFNVTDGKWLARDGVVVSHNPTATVANQNLAYARARCTNCRTVAVAVQVLLVEGKPTSFQPANAAVAVNENCSFCQTFAYANQVVLTPYRPVHIGKSAQERIEQLQEQIDGVTHSAEAFPQMSTDLDGLTAQLVGVVQAEIQRSGSAAGEQDHRQVDDKES